MNEETQIITLTVNGEQVSRLVAVRQHLVVSYAPNSA